MDALLDRALDLVVRDGIDALTVQRLAEAGDASIGAMYRYFPSKQALVAALQIRAIGRLRERLDRETSSGDALARVVAAAKAWARFADASPAEWALVDGSLSDPRPVLADEQAREVAKALQPVLDRVGALLASAAEAGQLSPGDAAIRTRALWAGVHGVEHFRKLDRLGGPSSADVRGELVRALLVGWGADPSALRRATSGKPTVAIGVTGAREGATSAQKAVLERLIAESGATELHHGDAVGVDAEAHAIARKLGIDVIVHPPDRADHRARCEGATKVLPVRDALERNRDIVAATSALIAVPEGPETRRSGTWATIRYAREAGRPIRIVWPNGKIDEENAP